MMLRKFVFASALAAAAFGMGDRAIAETEGTKGGGEPHASESHTPETHSPEPHEKEDKGDGHNEDGGSGASPSPGANPAKPGAAPSTPQHTAMLAGMPVLTPEQTKAAILAGQAASMPLLLAFVKQNYPGEVIDVKLHDSGTGYVYEVRYLASVIFLHTVYLDALTLKTK